MDKRLYNKLIAVAFCGYISIFMILNIVSPDKTFSENENRMLQGFPDFSIKKLFDRSFTSSFEKYITDQFVMRDSFVAMKAYIERAMCKKESNGIYIAEDGMLIEKFSSVDYDRINKNIQAVDGFCAGLDVPSYVSIVPSSAYVYRDRLPAFAPNADQQNIIQYVYNGINYAKSIDVSSKLIQHSGEYIYYNTDHHWTSLGAYYGYAEKMQAMGLLPSELGKGQIVSDEFFGTYYSKSGVRYVQPDSITKYQHGDNATVSSPDGGEEKPGKLYDQSYLKKKDKYGYFLGGNQAINIIRCKNPGKRLLFIRDSFANCQIPFMTNNFSEIHMIDLRYTKINLKEYIKQNAIDTVLIEYGVTNFINDTNIAFLGLY